MMHSSSLNRWEALALSLAITLTALALPSSNVVEALWHRLQPPPTYTLTNSRDGADKEWRIVEQPAKASLLPSWVTFARFADTLLLLFGLALTLPARSASGLRIGDVRNHWRKLLLLIGGPLLLTAIVYPNLSVRPFAGADLSIWLISPAAQDLIFGGTVYRLLRPHFATPIHRRIPMEWTLPVGGLFFAGWHVQNYTHMPADYVTFQLFYTWAAFTFVGLTRQWTGSLYYIIFAHMAGNGLVWAVK